MRVGDCCVEVVERITGASFHGGNYVAGFNNKKASLLQWYGVFLKKGEKQTLIDGMTFDSQF